MTSVNVVLAYSDIFTTNYKKVLLMNDDEPTPPLMQRVLDNPFILLFFGVALPAVLYLIWGIMEIISIPIAS